MGEEGSGSLRERWVRRGDRLERGGEEGRGSLSEEWGGLRVLFRRNVFSSFHSFSLTLFSQPAPVPMSFSTLSSVDPLPLPIF